MKIRSARAKDGRQFSLTSSGGYQVSNISTGSQMLGFQSFQAAKRAGWKGFFLFPQLQPMRRMTPITRDQINRGAQWLYDNVGLATSIVDRLAVYEAGSGMWPKAQTKSRSFNSAVTDIFHQGVKDPRYFDLAKQDTYYSAQVNIRRHIRLFGDDFGQLIRGSPPRMKFYPAYACANAKVINAGPQDDWRDGVQTDENGAITAFRMLTKDDGSTWQDVPAEDMLHFHDLFLRGQTRGLSAFSKFAEKLFTIDDIVRAEANGALMRARIAYALTTPSDNGGGGPTLQVPGTNSSETVQNPDGSQFQIQRIRFTDGESMDVPELPAGYDLKMVESGRPGPNLVAFWNELKEDIALATKYTPEFIAFMARSGGAVTRFFLEDAQMQINDVRLNQLEPQFAHRYYIFNLWQRIKGGQFDRLDGGVPDDWWRYEMHYPKLITVDKSKDARIDDGRLDTGKMSPNEYFGQLGLDCEEVEDMVIRGYYRRRRRVVEIAEEEGVPPANPDDVFRPPVGGQGSKPPEDTEDPVVTDPADGPSKSGGSENDT